MYVGFDGKMRDQQGFTASIGQISLDADLIKWIMRHWPDLIVSI